MVRRVEMIAMASALALLSVIRALNVDGPLGVMKSDCFERLAIGQRLYPQDVYKSVQMKTVQDCQIACTMENDTCRSFSIGVSTKGNSTCELSSKIIQETADLKPIGTKTDTDYDLYIKKMGCQLVIDRNDGPKPNRNDSGYNNVHNNKLPTDLHPDKPEIVQSSLISIRPVPNFLITNNDLGNEENMEVASSAYPRPVYGSFSDRLTYLPPGYDDGGGYAGQGYGYGDGGGIPQRIPEREPHFRPEKIPFTPYEPNQYTRPNYDYGYPRPHNSDDGYKYPRPEMGIPEQSLGMRPDEDYQNRPPPFRPLYPHLSNYLPPTPPTPYEEETRIPNGGLNHQTDQNATHPHQPSSSTPPTFPKRPTVFQDMNGNSIVSETTGPHGETITSIITEIKDEFEISERMRFLLRRRGFHTSLPRAEKDFVEGPSSSSRRDGGYKIWKNISLFLAIPVILVLGVNTYFEERDAEKERPPFVKYDYLYRRTKRFPWGEGEKSLFYNPHVNALPDGYEFEEDELK